MRAPGGAYEAWQHRAETKFATTNQCVPESGGAMLRGTRFGLEGRAGEAKPVVHRSRILWTVAAVAIISVLPPFIERSKRPLQWADLAEGRLRLDRLCRNGAS